MTVRADALARRLRGGRVDEPSAFPEDDYEDMTPSERIAALVRLSRRSFAIKLAVEGGERGHSGLPDRLVGGRR